MSEVLEVTERKAGVEYHREETRDAQGVSGVGAWNADSAPSQLGKYDFSEVKNLRQVSLGSLTIRTPPKPYALDTTTYSERYGWQSSPVNSGTIIAKCQYRANFTNAANILYPDCQIDVTLFYFSGAYWLALVAPDTAGPATANDVSPANVWTVNLTAIGVPNTLNAQGNPLTGWIIQYGLGLVVTLQGNAPSAGQSDFSGGTWTAYPDLTGGNNSFTVTTPWTVTSLGKDVCPTPKTYTVVPECQGDLLVINNNGSGGGASFSSYISIDPADPPNPQLIRLPLNCNYFLNFGSSFGPNDPRFWVHGPKDPGPSTNFTLDHDMSRAWGYRFVLVVEYTDPEGNNYQVRTNPSVDLWVPDFTYGPAQLGPQPPGGNIGNPNNGDGFFGPVFLTNATWAGGTGSGAFEWFAAADYSFILSQNGNNVITTNPLPNLSEFAALQTLVRQSIAPESLGNNNEFSGAVDNPYFWLAQYFGYFKAGNNAAFGGQAPYLTDVPVSLLLNCPNIIFDSMDFGLVQTGSNWNIPGIQGNVVGIEIYRTSHGQPLDSNNTKSVFGQIDASFAKNTYGYIGTIQPGQKFTDNIIDDAIAFGVDPTQYEGFLRGQFSGNVMTEYADSIIIGDIIEDYKVLPPASYAIGNEWGGGYRGLVSPQAFLGPNDSGFSSILQAYFFPVAAGVAGYLDTDVYPAVAPDGEPVIQFFAAYQDLNGYVSAPIYVQPFNTFSGSLPAGTKWKVSFTLPRGYDPVIQAVVLYRRYWDTVHSVFNVDQLAVVQCDTGYYVSDGTDGTPLPSSPELPANPSNTPPTQGFLYAGIPPGETLRSEDNGEIIWCASGQEFDWPATNFWVAHSFAHVTGLEAITGPLWVLTDQSVHLTNLTDRYEDETKYIGAISRFAVQKINKVVMFLSASGLYFAEASGVRSVPHSIHTLLLDYLQEQIPGQMPLTNVRRASLGWLSERFEMWVYLPSSKDIGGTLPHLLAILRFQASGNVREARWLDSVDFLSSITCYQFDFTPDFALTDVISATGTTGSTDGSKTFTDLNYTGFVSGNIGATIMLIVDGVGIQFTIEGIVSPSSVLLNENAPVGANEVWIMSGAVNQNIPAILDPNSFRSDIIVFNSHIDRGMFASYLDLKQGQMYVVDNDCGLMTWTGNTVLEKYWPMGEPLVQKAVTEISLVTRGDFDMTIANGQADSSGNFCATYGHLDRRVKLSNVIDNRNPMRKRVSGSSWETTSLSPLTRIVTIPDINGNHTVEIESIALDVSLVHNHP